MCEPKIDDVWPWVLAVVAIAAVAVVAAGVSIGLWIGHGCTLG